MSKLFNFLMLGLFLIAFQVVAVAAERGGDARVDTGDTRGGDARVGTSDTREELRATLKNCRQTKKREGKLSKAMRKECKAARQLKKQSRQ